MDSRSSIWSGSSPRDYLNFFSAHTCPRLDSYPPDRLLYPAAGRASSTLNPGRLVHQHARDPCIAWC